MFSKMRKAFGLEGKVALITGGGSGLGYAMAKCMTEAGARVIIAGRRQRQLDEAAQSIGPLAKGYVFDVTQTSGAAGFISDIIKNDGGIDVLINNAGNHLKKPVEQMTIADVQSVMDVHVLGAYALTQAVIPAMRARGGGSVIFISSMTAFIGMTNVTAYSAAKSAVLGLTKTLSGELSKDGIRVNAIVPGFIDTPMFRQATDSDPERKKKILSHTPMGRLGEPEDIGWAAVYLAADASRFVTGTAIAVDGGATIGF